MAPVIPLTDDSLMPWGKYKDVQMSDVPDIYLLFLWDTKQNLLMLHHNMPLYLYIKENIDAIKANIR